MDVFIGRQPIFNVIEEVVSYELLYRNQDKQFFQSNDADLATVDVLVNYFLSMGTNEVTKGRPGFVNFTENLLMEKKFLSLFNPSKIVIEILEDVPITEKLVERVRELKKLNFKIALDDFVLKNEVMVYDKLFEYTDYIKVDFLATPLFERMEIEKRVKNFFPHIQLLAEKVESRNHFEIAKYSGYTLFQGYFFEKPQIIKSTDIPPNTLVYLQIISLLKDDEPNIAKIAKIIEHDVSLSYKLLKVINDTWVRKKISSIKQAIVLLGLTELRKLIYLLAMREGGVNDQTDLYKELMRTSLFRAKVCEILARRQLKENFSEYFLVGMFSLIDTLLQRPCELILSKLPFSEEVRQTICGVETSMTVFLEFSIALDKMDFVKIDELATIFQLDKKQISSIYQEANVWSENSI